MWAGTYDPATGQWTPGSLGNGGTATLALRAKATGAGQIANTVAGTSNETGPAHRSSEPTPTPQPRHRSTRLRNAPALKRNEPVRLELRHGYELIGSRAWGPNSLRGMRHPVRRSAHAPEGAH
ncbi:DUF11 domain-containing protein [Streptomyces sp. NPDC053750]|uniref:DUF11 domain-containing protein n=1 Tax=Streptomyces sp. NPDC053750 TaxID=3365714 RepID=UPI0037CF3948